MNYLVLVGAIFPMLILTAPSHQVFAYRDPKHCNGDSCYAIGYNDGYNEAQNGLSPAYACVGHSEIWCAGYNDGFRTGNGGSNISYGQRSDQSANINIHGDININQKSNGHMGNNGFTSGYELNGDTLPDCVILCLNSIIRIK